METNGNDTDSALRFEIKDKLSDLLEDCSQDKGSNNTEIEDSVEIIREGKASTRLPIQWEEPSLQIIASNIELEKISKDSACKAMNRPSTLQEVPAHKAIEAKVEPKKANKPSEKAPEVEISKQRYNRLVQITDSERNHADSRLQKFRKRSVLRTHLLM